MSHVAIDNYEIPVAGNDGSFEDHLGDLLSHGIPGFVIDHQFEDLAPRDAVEIHRTNAIRIAESLRKLFPNKPISIESDFEFGALGQSAIGPLHHDYLSINPGGFRPENPEIEPALNTTITGGGRVLLAAFGTDPAKALKFGVDHEMDASFSLDPEDPHNLLLKGLVDPTMVNPKVYRGYLRPGYTVVAAEKGRNTAWHRYDTNWQDGERKVTVSTIEEQITDLGSIPPRGSEPYRYGFYLAA